MDASKRVFSSPPTAGAPRPVTCCAVLSCRGDNGLLSRFRSGHFGNLFARDLHAPAETAAHADTMVNLFTLGGTLLLTCPYALMGSLQADSWSALKGNLATCASNPWTGATPWGAEEVNSYVATPAWQTACSPPFTAPFSRS